MFWKPALLTLPALLVVAHAAPRIGEHPDRYRIVFDLNVKTTFEVLNTPTHLTITLPGVNLPVEGHPLGILNLGYQQGGNQITLTGDVLGSSVFKLDNPTEGMRLVIDVPKPGTMPETTDPHGVGVLPPLPTPSTAVLNSPCLSNTIPALPARVPPRALTGRLGLYVAELNPVTLQPVKAVVYNADQVFPLASAYKQVVLYNVMEDIDAGKYTLSSTLTTTEAQRSIEKYSKGTNTIGYLAERAIRVSENTASDMLHHKTGLLHPQQTADQLGLCNTRLLLTTKAFWTAQAGLGGKHFPAATLLNSAQAFASANRTAQVQMAQDLVQASFKVKADDLLEALDGDHGYFRNRYDARIDLNTQNTSTPREFSMLVAHPFLGDKLSPASLQFYRDTMAKGCCKPRNLPFPVNYWGAKAGSGWRLLTLTGYVELPEGKIIAYSYFNHESQLTHVGVLEKQIPVALSWVVQAIEQLRTPAPGQFTVDSSQ